MSADMEIPEISDLPADMLAAEALRELGETLLDEPDEYADQCDFAGCYPWLAEVMRSHLHDNEIQGVPHSGNLPEDDSFYTC
jgi:hypothetical protein